MKTMKVMVITIGVGHWIVCPKSKFTEEANGMLHLEYAWDMSNVKFNGEDECYVINKGGDPVRAYDGGGYVDGAPYTRLHNVTIKNFILCYEDEIREL